jgi:hypothetical protein
MLGRHSWLTPANGSHFFRQVDSDRTPCNAPPAANAARNIELVDPRRQFVRQPLPIPRANVIAHQAAIHVAEIDIEARVPLPDTFYLIAR